MVSTTGICEPTGLSTQSSFRQVVGLTLLLAAGACGPAEVVVMMEIDVRNAEGDGTVPLALADVEVQLLPYDRDAVFDSITAVFPTPEPEIPPDLLAAREARSGQDDLIDIAVRIDRFDEGRKQAPGLELLQFQWAGILLGVHEEVYRPLGGLGSRILGIRLQAPSTRVLGSSVNTLIAQ